MVEIPFLLFNLQFINTVYIFNYLRFNKLIKRSIKDNIHYVYSP